jgi:hypothetical protein
VDHGRAAWSPHLFYCRSTTVLNPRGAVFSSVISALGQKQTFVPQKTMSALLPIATAKADFRKRSCLLYPSKRTCAVQSEMSAKGQKRTLIVKKRNRLGGGLSEIWSSAFAQAAAALVSAFTKTSRSAFIVPAWVAGQPCGKPL